MFGLFGESKKKHSHNEAVEDMAERFERMGLQDVRADHTDKFPDTKNRNRRRPDVSADSLLGEEIIREVEHRENRGSKRSRNQRKDLQELEDENPLSVDFDTEWI